MNSCKKTKTDHNQMTSIFNGEVQEGQFNNSLSSMILNSNNSLQLISNMPLLTYLKLENTKIKIISDCSSLKILIVIENNGLKSLTKLDNVNEICCKLVANLKHIDLKNLTSIHIVNSPELITIIIPRIKYAYIVDCPKLLTLSMGSSLKLLTLDSCHSITNLKFLKKLDYRLNRLELINCSKLEHVNDISNCETVIIRKCDALEQIINIHHVNNITIDDCNVLRSISHLLSVHTCLIKCCRYLSELQRIHVTKFSIEYCSKIYEICKTSAIEMNVKNCNKLNRLDITGVTKVLNLEECQLLSTINFKNNPSINYKNLEINMVGDFGFMEICRWQVGKLTIKDNPTLNRITRIYDLKDLEVSFCSNLENIQYIKVTNWVKIKECHELYSIENVTQPSYLHLFDLSSLEHLNVDMAILTSVNIQECPELKVRLECKNLNELTLINTNTIILNELTPYTLINVKNSGYFPDMKTDVMEIDTPEIDEDPIVDEAVCLIEIINYQKNMIKRIIRLCRNNLVKKFNYRWLKTSIAENNQCVICFTTIEISNRYIATKCFHIFHQTCINKWIEVKSVCPLCNSLI